MFRMSFTVQLWASVTEGATPPVPVAGWHPAHASSFAIARFLSEWLVTFAKSTLSWQEPHAALEGTAFQFATSLELPVWQATQFESTAGKPTPSQEWRELLLPQM